MPSSITLDGMPLVVPDFWAIMTIIQEASSEGPAGMQAVGEVIRTRQRNKIFSDGTLPGTVLFPYQFSGWNTSDPNRIRVAKMSLDDTITLQAIGAWKMSKTSNLTSGATHYLNPKVIVKLPAWATAKPPVAIIGNHHFFIVS